MFSPSGLFVEVNMIFHLCPDLLVLRDTDRGQFWDQFWEPISVHVQIFIFQVSLNMTSVLPLFLWQNW